MASTDDADANASANATAINLIIAFLPFVGFTQSVRDRDDCARCKPPLIIVEFHTSLV
jgi:hypothetical protein